MEEYSEYSDCCDSSESCVTYWPWSTTVQCTRTCHGCGGKGWVPNNLTGKPEKCIICDGEGVLSDCPWYPYPYYPWPWYPEPYITWSSDSTDTSDEIKITQS